MRHLINYIIVICLFPTLGHSQYIQASIESGVYEDSFVLDLEVSENSLEVRYTIDGSEPNSNSRLYEKEKGILIEDRSLLPNNFSVIPTVAENWKEPDGLIAKGTIVWAQAFSGSNPVGEPSISSYFINLKYDFPIFSIVSPPQNLFSDSIGILVPGNAYNETNNTNGNSGLRGREWERPAQIEFIQNDSLKLRQQIGVRIHGLSSRALPQKSLRLYARNSYGKKYLEFPFFENNETEKFKRLILRSPSSDWSDTFFKDELIHQMVNENFDIETQSFLPSIVFINGEYWGVYNLRERQDEHYLSLKLNLDEDDINLLESDGNISEGDNQDYLDILQFVRTNSLQEKDNYDFIASKIDIQNFIDYHVSELFFANQDWPRNNYRFWQATKGDQRWRWLFFDCDVCMIFHHDDHFGIFLNNQLFEGFNRMGEDFPDWSTVLMKSLLENNDFRQRFIASFLESASNIFSSGKLIQRIDDFEKQYAPEVSEHIRRWHNPGNLDIWQKNVNDLRKFALHRPPYVIQKFQEFVGSPIEIIPNPIDQEFRINCAFESDEVVSIRIHSILGQEILTQSFLNTQELNDFKFKLPNLGSGNYILEFKYKGVAYSEVMSVIRSK